MTLSHNTRLAGALFLCAGVRLACLLFCPVDSSREVITPDDWHAVAVNLAEGRGYTLYAPQAGVYDWNLTRTDWKYRPTMRVPPVYPYLLAACYRLFGVDTRIGRILQVLFDVLTAWVVYRLGTSLFDRRAGLLAALAWACYLPEATHVLKLRSEPLFTLLLCLWAWMTVEVDKTAKAREGGVSPFAPRPVLSSLLLALTVLCRPSMLGFAILFSLGMTATRRSHRLALPVLCAVLAPWMLRGWLLFGTLVPVATNGGYSLYRAVYTIDAPGYITPAPPDFEAAYAAFTASLRQDPAARLPRHEAELDALFRDRAWRLIRAHPLRYAHVCLENAARLWFRVYGGTLPGWKDGLTCLINAGLLLLAGLGFRRGGFRRAGLPLALIGYNTLFYAMTLADPRYNTPIIPLLLILSARGAAFGPGLRADGEKEAGASA